MGYRHYFQKGREGAKEFVSQNEQSKGEIVSRNEQIVHSIQQSVSQNEQSRIQKRPPENNREYTGTDGTDGTLQGTRYKRLGGYVGITVTFFPHNVKVVINGNILIIGLKLSDSHCRASGDGSRKPSHSSSASPTKLAKSYMLSCDMEKQRTEASVS